MPEKVPALFKGRHWCTSQPLTIMRHIKSSSKNEVINTRNQNDENRGETVK